MSERHPDEEGRNRAYAVGIATGLDRAATELEDRAMEAFRLGCDKEANMLRTEARRFKKMANEAHPGVPTPEPR